MDTPYIYADNAATTPLSPIAFEAMLPYLTERFGNPSGIHRVSAEAARALSESRGKIAAALGARSPHELYFTSGGSESDTWVIFGAARRFRDLYGPDAPVRVITSSIEHHAVLHACDELERRGSQVVRHSKGLPAARSRSKLERIFFNGVLLPVP